MDIVPTKIDLENIFTGLHTKYFVPEYQRDYSWTNDQIEELWEDIDTSRRTKSVYFLGTFVLNSEDKERGQFDIVDGQQRLATFSILFSVFKAISENFEEESYFPSIPRDPENIDLAKKIEYISSDRLRHASEPNNYFIRMNKKDADLFNNIVRSSEVLRNDATKIKTNDRRLIKARKLFFQKIWTQFENSTTLDGLYKLLVHIIQELIFIQITVSSADDAYLLFESLNSKGMDLSVSDLVKNKLLMSVGPNLEQREELIANWDNFIKGSIDSRMDAVDFMRVYWEAIIDTKTTKKELYKKVKLYLNKEKTNPVELARDLQVKIELSLPFSGRNLTFPESIHYPECVESIAGEINALRYTLCYPMLLFTASYRPEDLEKLATFSLNFLFRFITICDRSVSTAKSLFERMLEELRRDIDLSEVLALYDQAEYRISDSEFETAVENFRTTDNNVAKYFLTKIERWQSI